MLLIYYHNIIYLVSHLSMTWNELSKITFIYHLDLQVQNEFVLVQWYVGHGVLHYNLFLLVIGQYCLDPW